MKFPSKSQGLISNVQRCIKNDRLSSVFRAIIHSWHTLLDLLKALYKVNDRLSSVFRAIIHSWHTLLDLLKALYKVIVQGIKSELTQMLILLSDC